MVNSGCGNCLAKLVDAIPVVRRHLIIMTVEGAFEQSIFEIQFKHHSQN